MSTGFNFLSLFAGPPSADALLPVAPDVSVVFAVCPCCAHHECEVFDGEERTATCPECSAEFVPTLHEAESAKALHVICEKRKRSRKVPRGLNRLDPEAKRAAMRCLKQNET